MELRPRNSVAVTSSPLQQKGLVGIGWGLANSTTKFSTTGCGKIEVSVEQINRVLPSHFARLFYLEVVCLSLSKLLCRTSALS